MKKTLTINLNGMVFNIDEDAYHKLNNYLAELGHHFPESEREEIMNDIEARIAELFNQKLQHRNVVEIKDVEEVIETLGTPNQFADEDAKSGGGESAPRDAAVGQPGRAPRRKFYRDGSNKRLGGVAAGIAAYLDWDVTLVRVLLLLLLVISVGWTFLGYILVWIIAPEATSVSQQLEMQGVEPTIDNIRNFKPKDDTQERHSNNALGTVAKIVLVIFLAFVGISLLSGVLGVFAALCLLLFDMLPGLAFGTWEVILLVSVILFLLIPAVALVMLCVRLFSHDSKIPSWSLWTMFVLFLASIVTMVVSGVNVARKYDYGHWRIWDDERVERYWAQPKPKAIEPDTYQWQDSEETADTLDFKEAEAEI